MVEVVQPYGPLILMLILTGQRLNEIAQARWSEVDFNAATLTVPFDRMKGGDSHLVPLTPMAMELLNGLYRFEGQGHIFTTTKGNKPFSNFSKSKDMLDGMVGSTRTPVPPGRSTRKWVQASAIQSFWGSGCARCNQIFSAGNLLIKPRG